MGFARDRTDARRLRWPAWGRGLLAGDERNVRLSPARRRLVSPASIRKATRTTEELKSGRVLFISVLAEAKHQKSEKEEDNDTDPHAERNQRVVEICLRE